MKKDVYENDDVIIKWFGKDMSLNELDDFIDENRAKFISKENKLKLDKIDRILKKRDKEFIKNPTKKRKQIYISSDEYNVGHFEVIQFY